MISWQSESSQALESLPGAILRYRTLSVIERNRAQSRIPREVKQQAQEAMLELDGFRQMSPEERQALPVADRAAVAVLVDTIEALENAWSVPSIIREGLIAIDGLEIDGKPVTRETVDAFLSNVPGPVASEVFSIINSAAALTPNQQKNSHSPSTSNAAVQGETSNSTAGIANETGFTSQGTANDGSPAT